MTASSEKKTYYQGLLIVHALSTRAKWSTFFFNLGVAFVLLLVCFTSIHNYFFEAKGIDKIVMLLGGITTGILATWLIYRGLSRFVRQRFLRQKLISEGKMTAAKLIGKQEREVADAPYYTIFFQFHPDFCLRQEDVPLNLYQLPIGSKLTVRYLSEDPKIAFLED